MGKFKRNIRIKNRINKRNLSKPRANEKSEQNIGPGSVNTNCNAGFKLDLKKSTTASLSNKKPPINHKKHLGVNVLNLLKHNYIFAGIIYLTLISSAVLGSLNYYIFTPAQKNVATIAFLTKQNKVFAKTVQNLEGKVADFQSKEQEYLANIDNLNDYAQQKHNSVSNLQKEVNALNNEILSLQLKERKYLNDMAELNEKIASNLKSKQRINIDLDKYRDVNANLETKLQDMSKQEKKYLSDIAELENKVQNLSNAEKNLQDEINKIADLNKELQQKNTNLNSEMVAFKSKFKKSTLVQNSLSKDTKANAKQNFIAKKPSSSKLLKIKAKLEKIKLDIQAENELINSKQALLKSLQQDCKSGNGRASKNSCSTYQQVQEDLSAIKRRLNFMTAKKTSLTRKIQRSSQYK